MSSRKDTSLFLSCVKTSFQGFCGEGAGKGVGGGVHAHPLPVTQSGSGMYPGRRTLSLCSSSLNRSISLCSLAMY